MQEYIKEVGRGKKGAKDLSYEAAKEAAERILDGEATDAQIGAFLIAERLKGETTEELLAFVDALRVRATKISHHKTGVLDCAGPYDGRSKSFAATIPVAAILAAAGVPVVLHGSASLPPKYGVTLGDVLQELGMQTVRNKQETANLLDREHLVFVNTEHYCEPLQRLRPVREQLGVRTMLNTAEKFLNVAEADCLVAGVFHTTVIEKAAELTLRLGYRKGMVVQGIDGSEDIPANRPSAVYLIENGSMEKYLINPKEYGLYADDGQAGLTAKQQAQYVQSVLQGEPQFREMVLLNSGLRLWLTSRTESIEQGIELARSILDSGKAWEKFVSVKE